MLFPLKFHLYAWVFYIGYYYAVNKLDHEAITLAEAVLEVPFFALICYVVYFILKGFFANGRYALGTLCLLCFYLFFGLIAHLAVYTIFPAFGLVVYESDVPYSHKAFLQTILVVLSTYSLFGLAYYLTERNLHKVQRLRIAADEQVMLLEARLLAEEQKRHYEYFALTSQFSQHMMANLMGRWMDQIDEQHPAVVHEMEGTYRLICYYMEAHQPDKSVVVPLIREVEQLCYYLDLQKAVTEDKLWIDFDRPKHLLGYSLPATSLLTLAENAVKHGLLNDPDRPLRLKLQVSNDGISFTCLNAISLHRHYAVHGIGLANLKRRLEIVYGNAYKLEYGTESGLFNVQLTINSID